MDFGIKNKKARVAIVFSIVILVVVFFRIYTNIMENEKKAQRVSAKGAISVETIVVKKGSIIPTLAFSANLEPLWSADISPKIDARLDRLYVDEGDIVKKGQVLAELDTAELASQYYQLEGNLRSMSAQKNNAGIELERNEKLYKENAISKKELDNSRFNKDSLDGGYASAEGALGVLREKIDAATLRSPKDGVIVRRYVHEGNYLKSGAAIVAVADTTELLATADVAEGQIGEVYLGADAKISVVAYKKEEFGGAVSRISPMASQPARTFKIEVKVSNSDNRLRAGMLANVYLHGLERKETVVIPRSAIVMREDQKTVYLVNKDNIAKQVLLEIGAIEGDFVEVLKGLSEGDVIISAGQNRIKEGSKVAMAEKGNDK